jgi:hypothetical protein
MKRHRLQPVTTARPAARRRGILSATTVAILTATAGLYFHREWATLGIGRSSTDPGLAHQWPDLIDVMATAGFLLGVLALAGLGYVSMVADIRAYLRSLRGALVIAGSYLTGRPQWARSYTPEAISAFGLTMPCNEADLLKAYRARVKQLHPDRGGDRRQFLRLQTQFEAAIEFLQDLEAAEG